MIKTWMTWINRSIGAVAAALVLLATLVGMSRPTDIPVTDSALGQRPLPPGAFALPKQACDTIGKTGFELKFAPMSLQLPDLRNVLVYNGRNGRPDAQLDRPVLHFTFTNNPTLPGAIPAGERLYLLYDKKRTPGSYVFSPDNAPTSIWIEPTPQGNEAIVKVGMKNENGDLLNEPATHAQFSLPEKEGARTTGKVWEMGKWRVDGSLLARQKARWMGQDQFLERHGGAEFLHFQGKHRIDFTTEDEQTYSVYVGLNDSLIWQNDRWKVVQPSQESLAFPLMVVKKIDDRLINFDLWDIGGKNKMALNLIKSNEAWMPQNIQQSFKVLGARTRSQYIFEVGDQRMLLSPQDWLLQTKEGWVKLATAQDIDDYVDRKLSGVLFVVDEVLRKDEKQVLVGVMFNSSRTDMKEVELAVIQGGAHPAADINSDIDDDIDMDDDDDDDEEKSSRIASPRIPNLDKKAIYRVSDD